MEQLPAAVRDFGHADCPAGAAQAGGAAETDFDPDQRYPGLPREAPLLALLQPPFGHQREHSRPGLGLRGEDPGAVCEGDERRRSVLHEPRSEGVEGEGR